MDCSDSLKVNVTLNLVSFSFDDALRTAFQNLPTLKIQQVSLGKNIWGRAKEALAVAKQGLPTAVSSCI